MAMMRPATEWPAQQERLHRKTLFVVVVSQLFGGAGLSAGVTIGALLARDMLGTDRWAGIPAALLTLGSAAAALLVGRLSQRLGRRSGLAAGFFAGGIGAAGVAAAAVSANIGLLFAALFLYGAGTAANLQTRYAGTDLAKPAQRATAVSIALVSTTFGAVAGPNLVDATGRWAVSFGMPALAGPFLLAAAAFLLAGAVLVAWLRPDPLLVANAIAAAGNASEEQRLHRESAAGEADEAPVPRAEGKRGLIVGTAVMVLTQTVMVAIMTMTPVHMEHHGHGLSEVGIVISVHIAAMFLPSLVTGVLIDKFGRTVMSFAAGAILLLSGVLAAAAPADSTVLLVTALALLGLGWNVGFISGTAMIVDATRPAERAKTQGSVDVLLAFAGASGGALSGLVVASASYAVLSLAGGLLALLLIPVAVWSRRGKIAVPVSPDLSE